MCRIVVTCDCSHGGCKTHRAMAVDSPAAVTSVIHAICTHLQQPFATVPGVCMPMAWPSGSESNMGLSQSKKHKHKSLLFRELQNRLGASNIFAQLQAGRKR